MNKLALKLVLAAGTVVAGLAYTDSLPNPQSLIAGEGWKTHTNDNSTEPQTITPQAQMNNAVITHAQFESTVKNPGSFPAYDDVATSMRKGDIDKRIPITMEDPAFNAVGRLVLFKDPALGFAQGNIAGICSATYTDFDGYVSQYYQILTSRHCVRATQDVESYGFIMDYVGKDGNPHIYMSTLGAIDDTPYGDADIAVATLTDAVPIDVIPALTVSNFKPAKNTPLMALGYSRDKDGLYASMANTSAPQVPYRINTDAQLGSGASGGPVVAGKTSDNRLVVVGVNSVIAVTRDMDGKYIEGRGSSEHDIVQLISLDNFNDMHKSGSSRMPVQDNNEICVEITASSLNVRDGATTASKAFAKANEGERYYELGATSNGWSKIDFNGRDGYVSQEFVQRSPCYFP